MQPLSLSLSQNKKKNSGMVFRDPEYKNMLNITELKAEYWLRHNSASLQIDQCRSILFYKKWCVFFSGFPMNDIVNVI